eukprot:2759226-Pleurochrysis_carterae.AAC.1
MVMMMSMAAMVAIARSAMAAMVATTAMATLATSAMATMVVLAVTLATMATTTMVEMMAMLATLAMVTMMSMATMVAMARSAMAARVEATMTTTVTTATMAATRALLLKVAMLVLLAAMEIAHALKASTTLLPAPASFDSSCRLVASSALGRATNSLHDVLGSVSCRRLLQLMRMGCAAANARYPTASFTDMHLSLLTYLTLISALPDLTLFHLNVCLQGLWKAGGTFHGEAAPNCEGWVDARIRLPLKPPFDMGHPESSAGASFLLIHCRHYDHRHHAHRGRVMTSIAGTNPLPVDNMGVPNKAQERMGMSPE